MKKRVVLVLGAALLLIGALLSGCSGDTKNTVTDEEILKQVEPYLTDAVQQTAEGYDSEDAFLKANLGLGSSTLEDVVLYMGMPNQNTTYFLMAHLADGAEAAVAKEKLEQILQGFAQTAEMGYISGNTEYTVLEAADRIFAVMHADAASYAAIVEYLEQL